MTDTRTNPHPVRTQLIIWAVGLLVTAVMLGLGLWQMDRFRTQGREAIVARMNEPAQPIRQLAPDSNIPKDAYGRQASAEGEYVTGSDLLIPDPDDAQRCRVLTALRLPDGALLPVVRGVASPCGATPVTSGAHKEVGVFLPSEAEPERELPHGQLGSVRLPRLAQLWQGPLAPGYLALDEAHAQAHNLTPAAIALPNGAGQARNSGYALQWWLFAGAAVAATAKLSHDAARGTGFMTPKTPASGE